MEISGLRAMVVGGASGMARATAERIAAGGGKVAILDREGTAGAEVAAAIGGSWHPCDIMDFEGTEVVFNEAVQALGGLDAAVITAGGGIAARTLSKDGPHPLDSFRRTVDLNLIGTFNLNRLQAWEMSKNDANADGERGVIINTASVSAFEGQIGQIAYSASKGGVASMTLPAARELARQGIRVVAIAPGIFDTPLLAGLPEPARVSLGQQVPFPPRLGQPAEFAAFARQIIENEMLNGCVLRLDGALRMAAK